MTRPLPPVRARRVISENRFLSYVEEDLLDRHQQPYTYYQVEAKFNAVLVLPVLPDGRLVLERIYRHPYRRYFLEFPAGGIEHGEDPLHAAGRELAEETGYRAGSVRALGTYGAMPGLLRMQVHVVLAQELVSGAEVRHDGMEMLALETLTLAQAWAEADAETDPASSFLVVGLLYYQRYLASRTG